MTASKGEITLSQTVNFDPPITPQRLMRLVDIVADPAAGEIAIMPKPGEAFILGEYSTLPCRDIKIEPQPPIPAGWHSSKISQIVISSTDWESGRSKFGNGSDNEQARLSTVTEYAAYLIQIYNNNF